MVRSPPARYSRPMAKSFLSTTGNRLSAIWHKVMAVTVDEGIGWQARRPSILWAVLVILFAVIWMAIGYTVSGVVGKLFSRRDRRLG